MMLASAVATKCPQCQPRFGIRLLCQ